MKIFQKLNLISVISAALLANNAYAANELSGFALLPATTFAEGPTSGQFAFSGGGNTPPWVNKQPVQGFSAVLNGPTASSFYVMPDNGFGSKANSPDALLRIYALQPNFKTWNGSSVVGSGTVSAVDYQTGAAVSASPLYPSSSFINLRDPDQKLGFPIIAGRTNYPGSSIPVDPSIQNGRLLTGSDFDIESMRKDKNGNLWFGEEFGPYLVKTDATGKVLRQEIPLPGVQSPDNPNLVPPANLGGSRGFEGMAINTAGDKLYTLLEGTVTGDPGKSLRINEFDINTESYTSTNFKYQLEAQGTNIGDMTAVNDHQFLVIERNGGTATSGTPFKKIYLADTDGVANGGFVHKTELVDLMNLADPHDLNGDGSTTFTFPFVTIESVLILDPVTLLVLNDNNFPSAGGRDLNSDNNEFIKITLSQPLQLAAVPVPAALPLLLSGLTGFFGFGARRKHK